MRISDWSSDVCSSDLFDIGRVGLGVVQPVLVLLRLRMIDHAGDMAGAGQHEAHRPAIEMRRLVDRAIARDMVLPAGLQVARALALSEVEPLTGPSPLAPLVQQLLLVPEFGRASLRGTECQHGYI